MTTLHIKLHRCATAEIQALARSANARERKAAAQLFQLLALIRSAPVFRDRMLAQFEQILVQRGDGTRGYVDIKLIQALKDIADDDRYHTDAVRRIRDIDTHPADEYRVFFAPRHARFGPFQLEVLGFFHRSTAYSEATLQELKRRYENSI